MYVIIYDNTLFYLRTLKDAYHYTEHMKELDNFKEKTQLNIDQGYTNYKVHHKLKVNARHPVIG